MSVTQSPLSNMVESTSAHSLIPVPVKRQSMQIIPGHPGPSSSPTRTHRRTSSTASTRSQTAHRRRTSNMSYTSGDEGGIRTRTPGVAHAHARLNASLSDASAASPVAHTGAIRSSTPGSIAAVDTDDEVHVNDVDRIRAPTRSSLNKQRNIPHSNASFDLRRRAGSATPSSPMDNNVAHGLRTPDERLGLSRIPRSTVTNAISLHNGPGAPSFARKTTLSPEPEGMQIPGGGHPLVATPSPGAFTDYTGTSPNFSTPSLSPLARPRKLGGQRTTPGSSGKSSKMIDALQTDLESTKVQLERAKHEIRNCRREIGTLTRTTEDLRETRSRMRAEAESLNNVITRKERMITEVLSRARAAESAVTQHSTERKEVEAKTKKAISDARVEVAEAVAAKARAESECDALRDAVRSLREVWARDVRSYQEEVARVRTETRAECEAAERKQGEVLELVRAQAEDHKGVVSLVTESNMRHAEAAAAFEAEIASLRQQIALHASDAAEARGLAHSLGGDLSRLRRLAKLPARDELEEAVKTLSGDEEGSEAVNGQITDKPPVEDVAAQRPPPNGLAVEADVEVA